MGDVDSALRRIGLFRGLPDDSIDGLARFARVRRFSEGQWIQTEGDADAPVLGVVAGSVRTLLINPSGRKQVLIHLRPGAVFNLPAAFARSSTAPASAVAVGEAELVVLPLEPFRRRVLEDPALSAAVLGDLSNRLRHLASLTQDLALRSVRARLARFLLRGGAESHATQDEIAASIGTVREVVSRNLKGFARAGIIDGAGADLVVMDRAGLKDIAEQ